jgi:Protein of unknown function (DUF3108)
VALLALVGLVSLAHLWFAEYLAEVSRLGAGAADTSPRRIEVAFVQELAPAAPPAAAPPRERRAARRAVAAPAVAASAPAPAEEPPAPPPLPEPPAAADPPVADASVPAPDAPASAASVAGAASEPAGSLAAAAPASAASAPVAFEWPPSTRLSYTLTGNYRGPVDGSARVEWLRREGRYQVHLDVYVGPTFAPLVSRRMSSDGEITEQGLKPQRYDEETRVALREPRRLSIAFEEGRIVLPGDRERPTMAGVQDTASQFVQLTWLFTTRPERLRAGEWIEVPLALPRHVDLWRYEVVGEEALSTPAGTIPTFYVRPRRETRPGGDLLVEAWFAPSLQYLPVRIRIRQDAETSVDLLLDSLPKQEQAPRR